MRAYWLDDGTTLTADELRAHDVLYQSVGITPEEYQPVMDELKQQHGYITQDVVELSPEMPNLKEICAKFDPEHLHTEDEVRFVLDGEGVFDIRTKGDRMFRVEVSAGDLIVVPKDRNHRFELTPQNHIRCVRLFQDMSGWVPHYRS